MNMAGGKIQVTGNQALAIYDLLGSRAKLSSRDVTLMGKMRERMARLLKTDDDGAHRAMEFTRKVLRYSVADIANGISEKLIGEPIERQDGTQIEIFIYSKEERANIIGDFTFDDDEKATIFRLFMKLLSSDDPNGAKAEVLYRQAGWFPSMQKALESAQKALCKEEPFVEPVPDELEMVE